MFEITFNLLRSPRTYTAVFVVCLILSSRVHSAKLPDNVQRCSRSSPEFKQCLSKSILEALASFKKETPELGLPSLDPLVVPSLIIGEGTGPVNVVQNFSNVEIHGLTDATMTVTEADMDKNNIIVAQSITKTIVLLADYNIDGKILVLPVKGNGKCNITIANAKSEHRIIGEKYSKKDRTYLRIKEYTISMDPERMFYDFQNLFGGDQRLGSEINKVMNENWKEVYADIRSGYEKSFGMIFKELANNLFSRVPFDDIFLP